MKLLLGGGGGGRGRGLTQNTPTKWLSSWIKLPFFPQDILIFQSETYDRTTYIIRKLKYQLYKIRKYQELFTLKRYIFANTRVYLLNFQHNVYSSVPLHPAPYFHAGFSGAGSAVGKVWQMFHPLSSWLSCGTDKLTSPLLPLAWIGNSFFGKKSQIVVS